MKSFSLKAKDVNRRWYLIDASRAPLGRTASVAAQLLMGKAKPTLTHHIDDGDYVVIINASKIVATGNKAHDKIYHRHSGYPSGLRSRRLKDTLAEDPTFAIKHAVRGMLPVNKLRDGRLKRLKVYAGHDHQHEPQQPVLLSVSDYLNGQ